MPDRNRIIYLYLLERRRVLYMSRKSRGKTNSIPEKYFKGLFIWTKLPKVISPWYENNMKSYTAFIRDKKFSCVPRSRLLTSQISVTPAMYPTKKSYLMGTIYSELTDHWDELEEEFLLQSSLVFSSTATKFLPFLLRTWKLLP